MLKDAATHKSVPVDAHFSGNTPDQFCTLVTNYLLTGITDLTSGWKHGIGVVPRPSQPSQHFANYRTAAGIFYSAIQPTIKFRQDVLHIHCSVCMLAMEHLTLYSMYLNAAHRNYCILHAYDRHVNKTY